MATLRTVIVDPGGTGDYTSLNAALSAESKDLVSLDRVLRIECKTTNGNADTNNAGGNIPSFICDDTRYVHIINIDNPTKWDATKYRITPSGSSLNFEGNSNRLKFIFEGLQIGTTGSPFTLCGMSGGDSTAIFDLTYKNCIINGNAAATYGIIFDPDNFTNGSVLRLINTVIYNVGINATRLGRASDGTGTCKFILYNNVLAGHSSGRGLWLSSGYDEYVKNNIILNGISGGSDNDARNDYNARNVNADHEVLGSHGRFNQTFSFVDTANGDFHLTESDTGAKGFGVNLSEDAQYPFNDDIDGNTRGETWDIGLDQITSGASVENISGSVSVSSGSSASVKAIGIMQSTLSNQAAIAGTLKGKGSLELSISSQSTLTGTLQGKKNIAGNISSTSTITNLLLTAKAKLEAVYNIAASLVLTITAVGALASSLSTGSGLSGGIHAAGSLQSAISSESELSGTIKGSGSLQSSTGSQADFTAVITGKKFLSGEISSLSIFNGTLTPLAEGSLSGNINSGLNASASIKGVGSLQSLVGSEATLSGTLTPISVGSLSGEISSSLSISANLEAVGSIQSAVSNQSHLSGILTGSANIISSISAASSLSGTLTLKSQGSLAGNIISEAVLSGILIASSKSFAAVNLLLYSQLDNSLLLNSKVINSILIKSEIENEILLKSKVKV